MNSGMTQDEALERAITELTGYTIAAPKPSRVEQLKQKERRPEKSKRKTSGPPPEHVLRNIQRIKKLSN
jgi:hypothetical protein